MKAAPPQNHLTVLPKRPVTASSHRLIPFLSHLLSLSSVSLLSPLGRGQLIQHLIWTSQNHFTSLAKGKNRQICLLGWGALKAVGEEMSRCAPQTTHLIVLGILSCSFLSTVGSWQLQTSAGLPEGGWEGQQLDANVRRRCFCTQVLLSLNAPTHCGCMSAPKG